MRRRFVVRGCVRRIIGVVPTLEPAMLSLFSWSINDATEACRNALEMGDWAGVAKYAAQAKAYSEKAAALDTARTRGRCAAARAAGRRYTRPRFAGPATV